MAKYGQPVLQLCCLPIRRAWKSEEVGKNETVPVCSCRLKFSKPLERVTVGFVKPKPGPGAAAELGDGEQAGRVPAGCQPPLQPCRFPPPRPVPALPPRRGGPCAAPPARPPPVGGPCRAVQLG